MELLMNRNKNAQHGNCHPPAKAPSQEEHRHVPILIWVGISFKILGVSI